MLLFIWILHFSTIKNDTHTHMGTHTFKNISGFKRDLLFRFTAVQLSEKIMRQEYKVSYWVLPVGNPKLQLLVLISNAHQYRILNKQTVTCCNQEDILHVWIRNSKREFCVVNSIFLPCQREATLAEKELASQGDKFLLKLCAHGE